VFICPRRQRPQKPQPAGFLAVFEGSGISDHISPADITTLSVAGEEYLILYICVHDAR
jgi:hypothetical protein